MKFHKTSNEIKARKSNPDTDRKILKLEAFVYYMFKRLYQYVPVKIYGVLMQGDALVMGRNDLHPFAFRFGKNIL